MSLLVIFFPACLPSPTSVECLFVVVVGVGVGFGGGGGSTDGEPTQPNDSVTSHGIDWRQIPRHGVRVPPLAISEEVAVSASGVPYIPPHSTSAAQ